MRRGTPPWLNADKLKETKKNHEGGAEKNMKEEDSETNRENVKTRVRNTKDIDLFGLTFFFKLAQKYKYFLYL